jgi:hypothetical protein
MRADRVFTAPSLAEVIRQLLIYRPTGLLTIQRSGGVRQEEVVLAIDRGVPTSILRDRREEEASDFNLARLNAWGEIHFTFQSANPLLQLPSPGQSGASQPRENRQQQNGTFPSPQPPLSSATHPLPPIPGSMGNRQTAPMRLIRTREEKVIPTPVFPQEQPPLGDDPLLPSELVVPALTGEGREFSATTLPRYDRVVFLLINGRRSVTDLSQLTRRPTSEVLVTLQRLKNQQLIDIEILPPSTNGGKKR